MIQGHRLKQMRTKRGLSQGALGKLAATDAQYISKFERGILTSMNTTTLERLLTALYTSADYLLGLSDVATLDVRTTRPATRTRAARRPAAWTNGHTPVAAAVEPQPARMCPRCRTNMQPLDEGTRLTCPGCHYTVAGGT